METIRSEEEDETVNDEPPHVPSEELSTVVINPFWAGAEDQRPALTVKSPPAPAVLNPAALNPAALSPAALPEVKRVEIAPVGSTKRRLVKQKRQYQSTEDVVVDTLPVVDTASSGRGSRSPRQHSVESRLTLPQGPIDDGAPLPPVFEPVPPKIYGKPLQEIDPTVKDKVSHFSSLHLHSFFCCFFLFVLSLSLSLSLSLPNINMYQDCGWVMNLAPSRQTKITSN